jgi:hypothetical protein
MHRLNTDLYLQTLFGLLCTAVLIECTQSAIYTRALLVSQDRRRLFVTPWSEPRSTLCLILYL